MAGEGKKSGMPGDAPVVYIRRLRSNEMEELTEDLRLLLPGTPGDSQIFCVAPSKMRSHGILKRSGRWQDNNYKLQYGIQMLILRDGCQFDLDTLCQGILTDVTKVGDLHRETKNRLNKKTQEELVDDAKEAARQETIRLMGQASGKISALDAFVVENRVIHEDHARIFAKWIGADDSSEHEGCHCTLSSLHMVNTMLRNEGCAILASSLSKNVRIKNINFGHNNIGDVGGAALFKANIGRGLSVLKLAGNCLGDRGCRMIPPLLETAPLVELHLQNNVIADHGMKSIAQGIGLSHTLHVLNLNGNRIRDAGVQAIASVLLLTAGPDNDVLGAIAAMSKQLGKVPPEVIQRHAFVTNTTLGSLHLASNWLQDDSAQELAQVFRSNFSLTNIELASNRIGDPGARALAESLRQPYVDQDGRKIGRNLVLSCNKIGPSGMGELGRALKVCRNLHTLSAEGMHVTMHRRADFQKNSAMSAPVEMTGSRKLPRIRLEAIHHEHKVVDLEEVVKAEFRPKTGTSITISGSIKDVFLPVDRFIEDHQFTYKYQSGWGATTARGFATRLPTPRISTGSTGGASTARISTQSSRTRTPAGYTGHLMNNAGGEHLVIDDDPDFKALCRRLNVPVQDQIRNRLEALNIRQREQRAKIYDRFLDTQAKFHRVNLTSAVQVQSLFRMKTSTKLAASLRQKNLDEFQSAAKDAKFFLATDRDESMQTIINTLSAPGKRRLFSNWAQYHAEAQLRRKDLIEMFSTYCNRMGVSACGTRMLKSFISHHFQDHLSMKGMGISCLSARALSFLFMGVENCRLCRGTGTMSGDAFKGISKDPMSESLSVAGAFDAVDLDGSGEVDASELLVAFRVLGLHLDLEEVQAVMDTIDEDQSGQIGREEFQLLFNTINTDRGPGQCVLCKGKGHTGKACVIEEPYSHKLQPLLATCEWLGHISIRELNLSNNCLRSSGAQDLVNMTLRCADSLRILRVAHNSFGDEGATAVAFLFSCPTMRLVECDLSGNNIGDHGMKSISEAVQMCKTLKVLHLGSNSCTGSGCHVLGNMVEENQSLTELDVSWNGIGGEQASAFWKGVENSVSLQRLHAHWNGFCDIKACEAMSHAFRENRSLTYLDLSHNRITEQCSRVISEGFALNDTLIELRLDGNPLGINGAKMLLAAAEEGSKDSDYTRTVRMENCSVGVLDMSMFDPSEPAARYMLDMTNESARQVLRNVLRLVAQGKAIFERMLLVQEQEKRDSKGELVKNPVTGLQEYQSHKDPYVMKCFMTRDQFDAKGMADSDPMKWEMPEVGTLEFNLVESNSSAKTTEVETGSKTRKGLDAFSIRCMSQVRTTEQKLDELEALLPTNSTLSFTRFKILFDILERIPGDGCCLLVEKFWHRIETDPCRRSVFGVLSETHREALFQKHNVPTFALAKNNPSGYYHLNLDIEEDRETAIALVEKKGEQYAMEDTLKQYAEGRMGGARDSELLSK